MTPTFFALVVCVAGMTTSRSGALYWQMVFCLFGAAAAIQLPGGAIVTPAVLFLPFLIWRAWTAQYGRNYTRRLPMAGVWLALAVICGLVGAVFLPRIFAGDVRILTVDRSTGNFAVAMYPLGPVSGNITQSGYALGSLFAFLSLRSLLAESNRLEHFRDAVLLLASFDCLAAVLNLAQFHLGFPNVLDSVRTAYALFEAYEEAGTGLMRISGTFSETSGFCSFSLPLFAFAFSLWLNKVRPFYSGMVAALLLVFLLIATSTTAYVGLALYSATLIFILTYRGYRRGTVPRIGLLVAGGLLALVIVGSPFVLESEIARKLEDYFQITVFNKMGSTSGVERGAWNQQAWSNFVDTYGLGVGLGSARASSLVLVLLSNIGLIGTLCFVGFLLRCFRNLGGNAATAPVPEAARQALLAALASAVVSSAVFDLGIAFYAFAAAASLAPAGEPRGPRLYDRSPVDFRRGGDRGFAR
jgi:hypothetical protein